MPRIKRLLTGTLSVLLVCGPAMWAGAYSPDELIEIEAASRVSESTSPSSPSATRDLFNRDIEVFFFSDFENDDGGLMGSLDWEWGDYAWSATPACFGAESHPSAPFSGARMWGTALNECYRDLGNNEDHDTCTNDVPEDDSILSLTVDLTNETTAWLSWAEWYDVFLPFDWVEIRVNDAIFAQVCGGDFAVPDQWVEKALDISAIAGRVATIEFHMMASTVINRSGWYIDDLAITNVSPLPVFIDGFESGDTSMWSGVQP